MKKTGIVFPGQGSQYIGMGRDLYERFDYIRDMFDTADGVLGFPITDLCFNGPEDELRQTYNTQPSLLLVGYAVYEALRREAGVEPFLVAGHSLGEYTALLASGFFTFEEALTITRKRGLLMEEACPKGKRRYGGAYRCRHGENRADPCGNIPRRLRGRSRKPQFRRNRWSFQGTPRR